MINRIGPEDSFIEPQKIRVRKCVEKCSDGGADILVCLGAKPRKTELEFVGLRPKTDKNVCPTKCLADSIFLRLNKSRSYDVRKFADV